MLRKQAHLPETSEYLLVRESQKRFASHCWRRLEGGGSSLLSLYPLPACHSPDDAKACYMHSAPTGRLPGIRGLSLLADSVTALTFRVEPDATSQETGQSWGLGPFRV